MRVHYVKTSRKSKAARVCRRCGHEVVPGEAYKFAEPRYGPKLIWCKDHSPRRSELTSAKIGPVYDAQDDFDVSECDNVADIESVLEDVRNVAEEVKGEYEEGLEAMPEGTESSPVAEEAQYKVDELESWMEALESVEMDEDDLDASKAAAEDAVNELAL